MLILVSGPSGSGKTTIMRALLDREIVSVTTRKPRKGEVDGVDYHFIDRATYNSLLGNDGLVEHSDYGGNGYGITAKEIEAKAGSGSLAYAIVDVHGMRQLRQIVPNTVTLFLWTDQASATTNLQTRGESVETVDRRLSTFDDELNHRTEYDYAIRNIQGRLFGTMRIVRAILDEYR